MTSSPREAVIEQYARQLKMPTLVPGSQPDGRCRFLDDASRCTIHAVSPYGCAFIDAHQPDEEFALRADALYRSLYADLQDDGPYARTWRELSAAGITAPPLADRQARLHAAMRAERRP